MQKCEHDVWTHKHTDRSTDKLVVVIDYKITLADLWFGPRKSVDF